MSFLAIISVPGYLPTTEPIECDDLATAWSHLYDCRYNDLEDPMNDEDPYEDGALDELQGMIESPELGTVYGPTPGYDGDHDLGLAYSVVRSETATEQTGGE